MIWERKGLIDNPLKDYSWAKNGALQPTALLLTDVIRLFCGFRDTEGVSRVGYIDVNAADPSEVVGHSEKPVLDIGQPGTFDESGLVPSALIVDEGKLYLYYAGYQLGHKVRFSVLGGLAVSDDDGQSFHRVSRTPVFERTDEELLFRVPHSVIKSGDHYRIWYGGGSYFLQGNNKTLPSYNIRYLETDDLRKVPEIGKTFIDVSKEEYRLGRPNVFIDNGRYKMFYGYSTDSQPYKLGFAESDSLGNKWVRKDDEINLPLSHNGWDSKMMAYPNFVKTENNNYLFYNGNDYGKEGFGYAILKSW